ncbi:MAG: hypothetical protein IPL07_22420 [Acidimicrobiaceae bacterium]|nr:hypothetical protein [Acidimicrobiaceae bacterium]
MLLVHEDRLVIPDEHRPHVIRRNGDVLPTVLVDGLVRGVWRLRPAQIEVRAIGTARRRHPGRSGPRGAPPATLSGRPGTHGVLPIRRWWIACPTARRSRSILNPGDRHAGAWSRARHATERTETLQTDRNAIKIINQAVRIEAPGRDSSRTSRRIPSGSAFGTDHAQKSGRSSCPLWAHNASHRSA